MAENGSNGKYGFDRVFEGITDYQRFTLHSFPAEKSQIEDFLLLVQLMRITPERSLRLEIPNYDDPQEILLAWQGDSYKMILSFPMDDFGWPNPLLLCGNGLSYEDVSKIIQGICVKKRSTGRLSGIQHFRDITSTVFGEFTPAHSTEKNNEEREELIVTKDDVRGAFKYYGLFYSNNSVISKEYILKTDDPEENALCYDYAEKTWSKIERDHFDELLRSKEVPGELSEIQTERDALWYLELERAFNGKGDDAAVEALLALWKEKKEEYHKTWESMTGAWPAKHVETTFYLKGKQYSITPDKIGLEKGEPWDEGFMEYIQGDIGADLKKLGATEIYHYGFLD